MISIICITLTSINLCGSPQAEYDTTQVQTVAQEYRARYLDLDEPEDGSTRQHIVRKAKDGTEY